MKSIEVDILLKCERRKNNNDINNNFNNKIVIALLYW